LIVQDMMIYLIFKLFYFRSAQVIQILFRVYE